MKLLLFPPIEEIKFVVLVLIFFLAIHEKQEIPFFLTVSLFVLSKNLLLIFIFDSIIARSLFIFTVRIFLLLFGVFARTSVSMLLSV